MHNRFVEGLGTFRIQTRWPPKLDLWVTLKKVNDPGFAWLLLTENLGLLPDCPLAEGVASLGQEFDPINKHSLCLWGEKLLVDMSLSRGDVFAMKTVANSVVRKSNTGASLDFVNGVQDIGFDLGTKLGACLLNEHFNVRADRNSSRRHAPCAMEGLYSRARTNLKLQ
jgi:hypothetical protein